MNLDLELAEYDEVTIYEYIEINKDVITNTDF